MIMLLNRKTLFGRRNGMAEMGRWALEAGRIRRRRGPGAGRWFSLALVTFLGALAVILYRRKRRQVSERYSMGETEGAWGGEQIPTGESIPAR